MVGTYAAVLVVCLASLAIGQAAIALCGVRRWSWLAPAVGLALLCAVCWGTVRLPGDGDDLGGRRPGACRRLGRLSLRGRLEDGGGALRAGLAGRPAGARSRPRCRSSSKATSASSAPASTPTCPSTCWRPTGSPHGEGSQLLHQGYPLGPHAIVVALNKGLGIGLVQGFAGLTVAVAVLASPDRPGGLPRSARRRCASPRALVVGLTYMVASYFAQGAFKETMQALFVLAFVLALREATAQSRPGASSRCASSPRR